LVLIANSHPRENNSIYAERNCKQLLRQPNGLGAAAGSSTASWKNINLFKLTGGII
jgi:hypothetical protein